MSREQVELTFLIGYLEDVHSWRDQQSFNRRVVEAACMLCGGCAVIPTHGYWVEGGETHQETFTGKLSRENTLHIKLSCETAKAVRVYTTMKETIAAMADLFGIETNWVHVQEHSFLGHHFSVKEEQEKMSRARYRDLVSPGTRGARP